MTVRMPVADVYCSTSWSHSIISVAVSIAVVIQFYYSGNFLVV